MRKIPTIFERDGNKLTRKRTKGCEWVFKGEGCATEKLDGTNVRLTVRAGVIVRVEKRRNPTRQQKEAGIIDPWYVDAENKPDSKHILKAVANTYTRDWPDGEHCCEAIGPKIQGNPLGLERPECVPFDLDPPVILYGVPPRDYDGLHAYLDKFDSILSPGHLAEGIVFHHIDGRKAKIKRKDFF